jgi:hypothetical protein
LPQQAERARSSWRRGIGTIDRKPSRGARRVAAAAASVVDGMIRPDELKVAMSTR